jgi:hypothetical protein
MVLLTPQRRLCCQPCIQAGYIFCKTRFRNPNDRTVDPSKIQNIWDLDYPIDKEPITASKLLSRWRNHRFLLLDNPRGEIDPCAASRFTRLVDITEHTLDGTTFQ